MAIMKKYPGCLSEAFLSCTYQHCRIHPVKEVKNIVYINKKTEALASVFLFTYLQDENLKKNKKTFYIM
jgi:hypothetical protein